MKSSYERAIKDALSELRNAVNARNAWRVKIIDASQAVRSLAMMCPPEVRDRYLMELQLLSADPSFTDVIRSVLLVAHSGLTAAEIKRRAGQFMNLRQFKKPYSCVRITLKRLKESGEVVEYENDGLRLFRAASRDDGQTSADRRGQ